MIIITWLTSQFTSLGLPESVRRPLAWAALAAAAIGLLWAGKAAYDASVIDDHETERTVEAIEGYDDAAEQRAHDAIIGIIADQERKDAIEEAAASEAAKPPSERATLPPTTKALNCKRMEQAFTERELAGMGAYKENCT